MSKKPVNVSGLSKELQKVRVELNRAKSFASPDGGLVERLKKRAVELQKEIDARRQAS